MDRGYFPVFRRIFDSDIWGHKVARDVWIFILGNVTHYPTKLCANYGCVDLGPGQMVTGLYSLAERNGFSFQQIRTAIDYLISTNRITRESTKRYSIITVCNWETYREAQLGEQQSKQQSEQQSDNNQITIRQQSGNNIQEVKKLRSKEEDQNHLSACADLSAAWNRICTSLPKCSKLTGKRRTHIRSRLKEYPLYEWEVIFKKIEDSPFLTGNNDRNWKADFDWITKTPDNAIKVLEGKYDRDDRGLTGEQKFIQEMRMKASGGSYDNKH